MDEMRTDTALLRTSRDAWLIPGAILAAGLLLATATYLIRSKQLVLPPEGDVSLVRPVSERDHIIGNPGAPVIIIEYADIDSNHAKDFQAVMQQLMTEYAPGGKVAWVYRHLPLIDQNINASRHAEAAECAASIGGADMFWRFIDAAHARAPGSQELNPLDYGPMAEGLGIRPEAMEDCIGEGRFTDYVSEDFENGLNSGAGGSPFSVILIKGHAPITLDGSVSYDNMKRILEEAISKAAG